MQHDIHGLPISTSAQGAAAFDRTLMGYLKYRADAGQRLADTLAADGEFALAHCLKGYFAMLSYKQANVPTAQNAAQNARRFGAKATPREQAHVAALDAWIAGDLDRALGTWEQILGGHPHDVLAFRLAHFNNFWLGRPGEMRASVERVKPKWARDLPGYGTILSCHCFSLEECGDYANAEVSGAPRSRSIRATSGARTRSRTSWRCRGGTREGIAWLDELERNWEGAANLVHHLWWHRALFHLERRETDAVLDLYDRRFRNLVSPLTVAQPDLYIDVQNAASMLFRLELLGIDVGDRWSRASPYCKGRMAHRTCHGRDDRNGGRGSASAPPASGRPTCADWCRANCRTSAPAYSRHPRLRNGSGSRSTGRWALSLP